MRPLAGAAPGVALCVLVVLMFVVPTTATSETTLVARLPLDLEGDIRADAVRSTVLVGAGAEGERPHLDLFFTAATARVSVINQTIREGVDCDSALGPLLCERQGSDSQLSSNAFQDVSFMVKRVTSDFAFILYDGAAAGANYTAYPTERATRMDVTTLDATLSYRPDPVGLDFQYPLPRDAIQFTDTGMRFEVRGDFTFMIHGADLNTVTPDRAFLHRTGTWESEMDLQGIHVSSERVTQYVRVEVTDAILTLASSGGTQEMYAAVEDIIVSIDGAISTEGAAGTIQLGERDIRSRGDQVRAEGRFTLTPTYVLPGANKQVVFGVSGEIDTLAVGPVTYLRDDAALAVAATGVGMLLAGLGAYFWPSLKGLFFFPLYAKLTKAKVLDQETRSLVHAKVEQDPGCQVKQIAESLEISWTTAAYHLRVLCKMGLVVAKKSGRHEHFFVAGTREAAGHAVVSALQNATARRIVETVLRRPGIIQKDLCDELGLAASTASGHLGRLRDIGALREEREWKKRRYFAGEALERVPVHIGPAMHHTEAVVPASA